MKSRLLSIVLVITLVGGFAWKLQSKTQTSGAEALNQLEADFAKATADRGLDGFMSYFADDASDLPNGGPVVTGKDNIRKALEPWTPDIHLTWTPVHADMAESGDIGYTFGTYVYTANDKDGKPVSHYGKYATVWKKQKDGSWKVAMDMGNSSPGK